MDVKRGPVGRKRACIQVRQAAPASAAPGRPNGSKPRFPGMNSFRVAANAHRAGPRRPNHCCFSAANLDQSRKIFRFGALVGDEAFWGHYPQSFTGRAGVPSREEWGSMFEYSNGLTAVRHLTIRVARSTPRAADRAVQPHMMYLHCGWSDGPPHNQANRKST